MNRALELGHKVLAFTEHETISNSILIEEEYEKIKDKNPDFKVIRGNEIYLVRNGLNKDNYVPGVDSYTHFILLALDEIGHKQLREISTKAWIRSYMQRGMRRVPTYYQDLIDIIGENKGHLVFSSGCIGSALGVQLRKYRDNGNLELLKKIKLWCKQIEGIAGKGNFYLEMQPSNNEDQVYVNQKIVELSKELDIPFIITNDAHYLKKEDLKIERIFLNSQEGEREVDEFYGTTYLMNDDEIKEYMIHQIGEENVLKAYQNIQDIADRAKDYSLKKPLKIPNLRWREIKNKNIDKEFCEEKIPMLKTFKNSEYKSDRYLCDALIDGIIAHKDLQNEEAYKELDLCLKDTWESSVVNKARWSAYFLNLQKNIDLCWEAGTIVGPGRGSGVGFLLLYALDITQINPLREKTKTYRFRFLNPERVSVLDIDTDISGAKREEVLDYIRSYYGEDRVANVLTLRTEKSKSAILAAARGLGIDVDIAQYIASLVPSERGIIWSLKDCYYGNEKEGRKPIQQFVIEMKNYPELWEVVSYTEGLIVGIGEHAGGVIFVDEPFTESTALMRAPNGDIMTQFELHTAEKVGNIKIDLLSVEAIDKIQICLDLLVKQGYIKKYPTLRETYENCIGIYNLERDNEEMWRKCWNHEVMSLFQMEKDSGTRAIALAKPKSVDELAILNSVIRLMAQEKGGEMPIDKFVRFKNNPEEWDKEMDKWGLTKDEKDFLHFELDISYGLCIAQEQFMNLVQLPRLGGFNLTWADRLRKAISKKNPKDFDILEKEFFENAKNRNLSMNLCRYVWLVLISMNKSYGF